MAEKCPICKFPIERHEQPGYIGEPFCSEFCATTTAEEKVKFLTMKEGDFGLYPCSESGCTIEDEYRKDECCGSCTDKRKARVRGELLQRVLDVANLPADLDAKITAELKR